MLAFSLGWLMAAGCTEAGHAPFAPPPEIIRPGVQIRPPPLLNNSDASSVDADGSLGDVPGDGSAADACIPIAGGDVDNFAQVHLQDKSATEFPFAVRRAYIRWTCESDLPSARAMRGPSLLIALTDGACQPTGGGTQLVWFLEPSGVGTAIVSGPNFVLPAPTDEFLATRFFVPSAAGGVDEWGNCAGVTATVTFETDPDTIAATVLDATFNMTLTDCRDPLDAVPLDVEGAFRMTVVDSLEAACP